MLFSENLQSGLKIGRDTVDQNLAKALQPMVGNISTLQDKALANRVIDEYNNAITQCGEGDSFDSSAVHDLLQKYDHSAG